MAYCFIPSLPMEPFFLSDLLQDVFQKFELAAEARGQRLVADIAPGLPRVTADLAMMERVLVNLIDNRCGRPRWAGTSPCG